MKRQVILLGAALFAMAVSAVEGTDATPKVVQVTPEQMEALKEAKLKRTGGRIVKPGTQKGEVVYINCQSEAKVEWIRESIDYFTKETRFKISLKEGKFNLARPDVRGSVSLFIVDDPALPNLLAAPENRWAMVNMAPLKCEKPAFFEARVKKQLTRGFAYLCGGTNSQYPCAITGGITGPEMLDRQMDHYLPVDVLMRFQSAMPAFGVTPARSFSYLTACKQGWAPAPTNDYQKAIWKSTHEIPKNPLTIEFDPKKGR